MRLRLGVLGTGHFGRFHVLKAKSGARTELVGVHDHNPTRAAQVAAEVGVPAMSAEAVIAASDAVIVACPTAGHHGLALQALRAGRHVLVEKPITATLQEADELIAAAATAGRVLQVGQLERFSAGMAALRSEGGIAARIGRPLYLEAVRIAPFRPRSLDVPVVLDLMIHDLDLALAIFGAPLDSVDAVGANVASDRTDIANARLRFANGAVATLTASRVSLKMERRLRLFGTEGYLQMDFLARTMHVVREDAGDVIRKDAGDVVRKDAGAVIREEAQGGGAVGAMGGMQPLDQLPGFGAAVSSWTDRDSLEAEHASFAAACLDGAPVEADGAAGRAALDAALRVEAAILATRQAAGI
ncbi:Gfo/Idh/MocA family protein [Roseomonas elaeocarpi]|uniref:Gfo/Idh/MocA family protein n=1 Tax=Roseomonas elaeocarpi TaxID=907779 RepID=A0ABV6JS33_9PROT